MSVGPRVHLHAYRGSGTLSSFNHFDPNADLSARYLTLFIRSFAQALEPMKKVTCKKFHRLRDSFQVTPITFIISTGHNIVESLKNVGILSLADPFDVRLLKIKNSIVFVFNNRRAGKIEKIQGNVGTSKKTETKILCLCDGYASRYKPSNQVYKKSTNSCVILGYHDFTIES